MRSGAAICGHGRPWEAWARSSRWCARRYWKNLPKATLIQPLVAPRAAIALGATAARALLGHAVAVTTVRGQWFVRADGLRVLVALHPAALLRAQGGASEEAFGAWVADLRAMDPVPTTPS